MRADTAGRRFSNLLFIHPPRDPYYTTVYQRTCGIDWPWIILSLEPKFDLPSNEGSHSQIPGIRYLETLGPQNLEMRSPYCRTCAGENTF